MTFWERFEQQRLAWDHRGTNNCIRRDPYALSGNVYDMVQGSHRASPMEYSLEWLSQAGASCQLGQMLRRGGCGVRACGSQESALVGVFSLSKSSGAKLPPRRQETRYTPSQVGHFAEWATSDCRIRFRKCVISLFVTHAPTKLNIQLHVLQMHVSECDSEPRTYSWLSQM